MDTFFLPYQIAWIKDRSRIKLMEKSRQIGMSWTTAYSLVRRHCRAGEKNDSWVSSRDELQAKLFIDDCKKFSGILNAAALECCGAETAADSDSRSLEFANGTRIWSLSSNPDAQAGKRGTRVLDEFALHPDPARLYAIAYPGITWGGSLEIISTHRGGENFFAKLVEEARYGGNPKKISLHRVTLQDALEQGFLKKLKANLPPDHEVSQMDEAAYFDYIKNSCADRESFLQEYMCTPADDRSAFLPYDSVRRCVYQADENWREPFSPENPQYLGVDVGRTRDLTVFWLLEKCGNAIAEKNSVQAEKFAHLAIAENPAPEAAWRLLAKAYELTNRDEDSYMAAAEAYKRNPDDIDATLFYLRNASRVLNNEKFLNKVYRAYEKFPNNPEIWVDLARTYKLIGDRRNALFFFKHFLANTPKEHILYDEMQREYEEYTK